MFITLRFGKRTKHGRLYECFFKLFHKTLTTKQIKPQIKKTNSYFKPHEHWLKQGANFWGIY